MKSLKFALQPNQTPLSTCLSVAKLQPANHSMRRAIRWLALAPLLLSSAWAQANTAIGAGALASNTTGSANSAFGAGALNLNTSGSENTGIGWDALYFNTTGYSNTATGVMALENNGSGAGNTAAGVGALANNGAGNENTAAGWNALYFSSGSNNTAFGAFALQNSTSGSQNIAVGIEAGFNLTTGSNNIDIGSQGVAAESNTIRIGTEGTQTEAFVAGIFNAGVTGGCQVVVASTGQLGCSRSSARYKQDIQDMGDASDRLMALRPVTFRYKADETVAYQMLPALLLNQMQKQAQDFQALVRKVEERDQQIASLQRQIAAMQSVKDDVKTQLARFNALEEPVR